MLCSKGLCILGGGLVAFCKAGNIEIAGVAASVPDNLFTKEFFSKDFGMENVEKFVKSTGISSTYRALKEQTASDLGYEASEYLLKRLGMDRSKIGIMLFITQSPDYRRPASACVLQKRLNLPMNCAVMDIGLGCSGFIYGHYTMEVMLQSSDSEYGLLILGETASKLVNPKDKSIAMMYGDAGAAVLYKKTIAPDRYTLLKSDGKRFKSIILPAGGFRDMYPERKIVLCSDGIERSKYDIYMDGLSIFSFSTSEVPEAIKEYLEQTQSTMEDYDLVLLHQANRFILKQIARKLNIPMNKIPISLDRYGNTGSVSIPLTICDYRNEIKKKKKKLRILAVGFGIGLSWGVTSFDISYEMIMEIIKTKSFYAEGIISPREY